MNRFFIIRHDYQNNDIYLTHGICDTLEEAQDYCLELLESEREDSGKPVSLNWTDPTKPNIGGTGFADAVSVAVFNDEEAFAIFEREV